MSRIKTCYPMNQTRINSALSQRQAQWDKWRAAISKVTGSPGPTERQKAQTKQADEEWKQDLLAWWDIDPRERLQLLLVRAEVLSPKSPSGWDTSDEAHRMILSVLKEVWLLCGCREWEKAFLRLQELNESTDCLPEYLYLNMWHWIDLRVE